MKRLLPVLGGMVVAVLAIGWWAGQARRPLLPSPVPAESSVKIEAARPLPLPVIKLKTLTGKPARSRAVEAGAAGWNEVQVIVDIRASYEARMQAVAALPKQLTEADWTVLRKYLLHPDPLDRVQLGQSLKNELMDALCAQTPLSAGLGEVLSQIYEDRQQDEVIRNYAVQHLVAYYEQASQQANLGAELKPALATLWTAVQETADSVGGTALLALKRLAQENYPGIAPEQVAAAALKMAGSSEGAEVAQITAFQVCAQLGAAEALPLALAAAEHGETISIRLSALGALGALGSTEQVPFLEGILQGAEDRLKPAAQAAVSEIMARETSLASQK